MHWTSRHSPEEFLRQAIWKTISSTLCALYWNSASSADRRKFLVFLNEKFDSDFRTFSRLDEPEESFYSEPDAATLKKIEAISVSEYRDILQKADWSHPKSYSIGWVHSGLARECIQPLRRRYGDFELALMFNSQPFVTDSPTPEELRTRDLFAATDGYEEWILGM